MTISSPARTRDDKDKDRKRITRRSIESIMEKGGNLPARQFDGAFLFGFGSKSAGQRVTTPKRSATIAKTMTQAANATARIDHR